MPATGPRSDIHIRQASEPDAAAVASIYNEGIEDRHATFQTKVQQPGDWEGPIQRAHEYPVLVAERAGHVVGWAAVKRYSDFPPYKPVVEAMLYVARAERGGGIGTQLLEALAREAEGAGFTKLIGKIFADNETSAALVRRCGFRDVGVHHRHGRLDGRWKDVLLAERLLGDAARAR